MAKTALCTFFELHEQRGPGREHGALTYKTALDDPTRIQKSKNARRSSG